MVEDPAFEVESRLWDDSVPKLRDDWRGLAIGPANGWLAFFGDMHQVGTKREAKRDMIRNSGSVLRHNRFLFPATLLPKCQGRTGAAVRRALCRFSQDA